MVWCILTPPSVACADNVYGIEHVYGVLHTTPSFFGLCSIGRLNDRWHTMFSGYVTNLRRKIMVCLVVQSAHRHTVFIYA